jgi:hypothetical protein
LQPGGLHCTRGAAPSAPSNPEAADPKDVEPTDKQFQAAQQAAKKLGGQFLKYTYPDTKRTVYLLHMPPRTKDEHLQKLPDLDFPFGLVVADTKVTDAGLNYIANLTILDALNLHSTKVTDVGSLLGGLGQLEHHR